MVPHIYLESDSERDRIWKLLWYYRVYVQSCLRTSLWEICMPKSCFYISGSPDLLLTYIHCRHCELPPEVVTSWHWLCKERQLLKGTLNICSLFQREKAAVHQLEEEYEGLLVSTGCSHV